MAVKKAEATNAKIISYKSPGPVATKFFESKAFVRGLMGPVGSGKSVACCMEIFRRIREQAPDSDGVRKTRWAIIRNTAPELYTTTVKTWLDWFPEGLFGKMNRQPPYTYRMSFNDGEFNVDAEIIFLACDRPEDIKKLLSLELTGAWINEARSIPKEILDGLTGRVNRFPSRKDVNITWTGVIMDTNPPDDTHWWYKFAEEDAWAVDREGDKIDVKTIPDNMKYEFFKQPSGLSKDAENTSNLDSNYYNMQIAGKSKEYINVYVHGNYGFIKSGQPVYPSWKEELHGKEDIPINPEAPVYIGLDFGNTPCAVFGQRDFFGKWNIVGELATTHDDGIYIPQFIPMLKGYISQYFPNNEKFFFGDPSGEWSSQDGKSAYDLFLAQGIHIRRAPTNKIQPRIFAVTQVLTRLNNGAPAFNLDKKKCKMLRKGFNGGYMYRKLQASGVARYNEEPEKNQYSHCHDALQYLLLGGGEYRDLTLGKSNNKDKAIVINNKWSVWKK